ncbi:hypothetical protein C8R41DRAFT_921220 [Lentinula lateritia]|uniref:Transaldolase n=1 Tax=Lentinula lateritia TaxID=40482 RepID=A0ABQ8VBV7_9AGAR|nr:hypothetical protein C8R41DRAFT_921220 [Lentinula lateritia]
MSVADSTSCNKPARTIRSLPAVPPSKRLKLQQIQVVDVPEWRPTLHESIRLSGIPIIAETTDYDTLLERRSNSSGLNPEVALQTIRKDRNGEYHLFSATQKVVDSYEKYHLTKNPLQRDPEMLFIGIHVFYQLLVEIGVTMMDYAPGPHFTFIDPRLALVKLGHGERDTSDRPSNTTSLALQVIVEHAKELLTKFVTAGVDQSRVTIGIPATKIGVLAAAMLERSGISTNLYSVSGLMHAIACAEARPCYITIDVASVLSWYERLAAQDDVAISDNLEGEALLDHPGIVAIQSILKYYRLHSISTKIVGGNFRTAHEISILGHEFDALSLSQNRMDDLRTAYLPFCASSFASTRHPQSADNLAQGSAASDIARAAPKFPTAMAVSLQLSKDNSVSYAFNYDWLHSEAFMNLAHPASPCPAIILASITLTAVGALKVQMENIHEVTQNSALDRVELRILPLEELYARRRAQGIRNDLGERYGCRIDTAPATPSSAGQNRGSGPVLKKKHSLKDLGKGSPASISPSSVASPLPRRPPLRRSSTHAREKSSVRSTTPGPSTSPVLIEGKSTTGPGRYASDEEVAKIIALTFGACMLGIRGIDKEDTRSGGKTANPMKNPFSSDSASPLGSNASTDGLSTVGTSHHGRVELSLGQRRVLALSAAIKEREEMKRKAALEGKSQKVVQANMVEGIDFF